MNCPEDAAFAKNLPDSESYIPTVSFNLATPFESNEPSIFCVKIQGNKCTFSVIKLVEFVPLNN